MIALLLEQVLYLNSFWQSSGEVKSFFLNLLGFDAFNSKWPSRPRGPSWVCLPLAPMLNLWAECMYRKGSYFLAPAKSHLSLSDCSFLLPYFVSSWITAKVLNIVPEGSELLTECHYLVQTRFKNSRRAQLTNLATPSISFRKVYFFPLGEWFCIFLSFFLQFYTHWNMEDDSWKIAFFLSSSPWRYKVATVNVNTLLLFSLLNIFKHKIQKKKLAPTCLIFFLLKSHRKRDASSWLIWPSCLAHLQRMLQMMPCVSGQVSRRASPSGEHSKNDGFIFCAMCLSELIMPVSSGNRASWTWKKVRKYKPAISNLKY